jgi:hypothetical protein
VETANANSKSTGKNISDRPIRIKKNIIGSKKYARHSPKEKNTISLTKTLTTEDRKNKAQAIAKSLCILKKNIIRLISTRA